LSSSTRGKSEKEDEIRRRKDDLQLKLRNDEQTLKTQLIHDHNVRRLQLKRRKLLLLHVLEQKLVEEVCFKIFKKIISSVCFFCLLRNVQKAWIQSYKDMLYLKNIMNKQKNLNINN
jgi:hypothetical protein